MLLHGGAGPQSVLAFADLLAAEGDARVLVPTHPGFSGTPENVAAVQRGDLLEGIVEGVGSVKTRIV